MIRNNFSFVIVGNELRTTETFNHEFKDLYAVRLKAEESNGNSYELPLIVKVTDINEIPYGLSLSANLIEENVVQLAPLSVLSPPVRSRRK